MYFRIISDADTLTPILGLDTTDGHAFKVQKQGPPIDVEKVITDVLKDAYDESEEEREATVAKLMRKLKPPNWKLWGRSTRVLYFDSLQDVVLHFTEFFFKKIDSFKDSEFLCTDSKGNYVATIKKVSDTEWSVTDAKDVVVPIASLEEAMQHILLSTDI